MTVLKGLAGAGRGWQGLAGAGWGWQGLAGAGRGWLGLAGAGRGWLGLAKLPSCSLNHLLSGLRPLAWVALCLSAMIVLAGQVPSCAFATGQQLGLAKTLVRLCLYLREETSVGWL